MFEARLDKAIAEIQPVFLNLVYWLVDETDAVSLAPKIEADGVLLKLNVAEGDMGKVIGKAGRNAQALRTILAGASKKYDVKFRLDIEIVA